MALMFSSVITRIVRFCSVLSKKNRQRFLLPYTCGITPKRVANGGAHFRGLAHGLHSFEETQPHNFYSPAGKFCKFAQNYKINRNGTNVFIPAVSSVVKHIRVLVREVQDRVGNID